MYTADVLFALHAMGCPLGARTVHAYRDEGLVSEPKAGAGRGNPGNYLDWADDAPAQAYAAHELIHKDRLDAEVIRMARAIALYVLDAKHGSLGEVLADTGLRMMIAGKAKEVFWAFEWLAIYAKALGKEVVLPADMTRAVLLSLAEHDTFAQALWQGAEPAEKAD